jgi:predicted SAM-dependent methyltransferase
MNQSIVNIGKKIVPYSLRILLRRLNWQRYYISQTAFRNFPANTAYCPIAKKEFKAFAKIGHDLVTPTNGARGRQRLVWHYLEHKLNILTNEITLLHTAPELSFYEVLSKAKNIKYVPGDKMVDGYSNQGGMINIDLTGLEFEDKTFDCIVSNHVLEHIPADRKAMSEMYRVLKVGGTAVITTPIMETSPTTYEDANIVTPQDRLKHFGQWDHVRWYGLDIKNRLEEVGFEVEMTKYGEQFSKEEFERLGFENDFVIAAKRVR